MEKTLVNTRLVQKLRDPYNDALAEVFSFGGGMKNGGLSPDAMGLLKGIFGFEYMGAAEYEFGAIPEMLRTIAIGIKNYAAWQITIYKTPIYVVGPTDLKNDINDRLKLIADDKAGYIKCGCDLQTVVGKNKYSEPEKCRTIGWLELDNNFAFFKKKDTWEAFCNLLGIKTDKKVTQ